MFPPSRMGMLLMLVFFVHLASSAPVQDSINIIKRPGRVPRMQGCYYNSAHFDNGERILTNEPCLNCTCIDSMLMCYLRVCPFVKPVGEECIETKDKDDCCPKIWCPEVPKEKDCDDPDHDHAKHDKPGCFLNEKYYPDGAMLPHDPKKPCEVCYCIRNSTSCVIQECELKVDGCTPVYKPGQCCPCRYNCSYEESTTIPPGVTAQDLSDGCILPDGKLIDDGEAVNSTNPCEHCYCMRNELVCAIQECQSPGYNCQPLPPMPGQCCPERYECPSKDVTKAPGLSFTSAFTSEEITTPQTPAKKQYGVKTSSIKGIGIKGAPYIPPQFVPVGIKGISQVVKSTERTTSSITSAIDISSEKLNVDEKKIDGHEAFQITSEAEIETTKTSGSIQDDTMSITLELEESKNLSEKEAFATTPLQDYLFTDEFNLLPSTESDKTTESPLDTMPFHLHSTPKPEETKRSTEESTYSTTLQQDMSVKSNLEKESEEISTKKVISGDNTIKQPTLGTLPEVEAISTLSSEQIKETTDNILRTTLESDHSPEELNLADTNLESDTIKNASKKGIETSITLEPENIDAVTIKPLHSNITTDIILPTTLETGYSPEELNLSDNIPESDTIKNASKNEIDKSLTLIPGNVDTVTTKPLHSNVTIPKSSITEEYEEIPNEEKKPDFIISTKHHRVKGVQRKPTLQENTHFKETSVQITPVYPNKGETIITDFKFSSELPSSVPPSESLLLESFGTQATYKKPKPLVYNETSEDISKDPENALKLPISILRITGPHKSIVIPGVTGVIGRPLATHSVKGIDQSEIIPGTAVKTPDIKYEGVKGHPSAVKGQPSHPQRLRPILPVGAIPGESNSPAPSRKRPVVMSIPGEGTCRVGKKIYRSGQPMESTDLCKTNCQCINSVVYCEDVICPKPPSDKRLKCTEIRRPNKCCPRYDCRTASFTTTEVAATEKEITTSSASSTPIKIITTVSSTDTPSEVVTIPTETGSYPAAASSPSNTSTFHTEKSSETETTSTFVESDETRVQTTVVETSPQTTILPVTGSGTFDEYSTSSERIFNISEESTPIVTESSESVKSSDFERSSMYPLELSTSIKLSATTEKEIDILHTSVYTDASSGETQFSEIEKTSEEPNVSTLIISEEIYSTLIPTTISSKPTVSSQKDEVYFGTVTPSSEETSTFLETKEYLETKQLSTLSPKVASTTGNTETYSSINTETYSPIYPKQSETISTEASKFSETQENLALTETTETSHKIGEELGLFPTSTEIFKETSSNDTEELHFVTTVLPQKAAETTTERKEFTKSEEIQITISAEPASSTKETPEHSVTSTDIEEITTVNKDITNLAITTKHPENYSSVALTEKLGTEEILSTTFDKVTETSAISTPEHTSGTSITSFISVDDTQSEEKRTEFSISTVFPKVTDIKFEDTTAFSKHEENHTTLSEGTSSNTSTVIYDGTSTYDVLPTISTKPTSDIISYEIDHSIDDASSVSSTTLIHESDAIRLKNGTLHPTSTESNVHETTEFSESEDVKVSNEAASISSKTTFDSTGTTLLDKDKSHLSTVETTSKPLLVTLSATTGYSKIEETFPEISETKVAYEQKPTTSENKSQFVTTSIPDITTSTEKLETEFPETTVSKATLTILTETEKLPFEEITVSDKTTTFSEQDFNSDEESHFVTLTLPSEEISHEGGKTSDGESTSSVTSSYHSQNTLAYTSNDTAHYDFTTTIHTDSSLVTSSPKSPEITTYAEKDDIHFEITISASPEDSTHIETTEYLFDKTTSKLSEVTAFSEHKDTSPKSTFTETSKFSSVDEKATVLSEANVAFETPTTSPKESTETPTHSEETTEFSEVPDTSTIISQKTDLTELKPAITDETAKIPVTLSSLYIETTASSEKKVIPFSVTTSSVKTATKEAVQALEFEDKKSYSETTALSDFTASGNEKLPESTLSSTFSEATLSQKNVSVSFITETPHSLSKFPETTLIKETSTTLEKIQPTFSPSSTLSEEVSVEFGTSSPIPDKTEIIQEEDKVKIASIDSETTPFLTTADHHEAEKSSLLSKTTESTEQNFFTFDNEIRTTLPPGKGEIDSSVVSPNPTSEIIDELSIPENLSTISKIASTFIGTAPESHEIPSVISETTFYEENESRFSVTTSDATVKIQEKSDFSDKGTSITSQEISTPSQTTPIIYEQKTSFEFTNTASQENITDYFVSTTLSAESSKSTDYPAEKINLNAEETYGHLLDKESTVLASSSSDVLEASEETKSTVFANKTFQLSNTTHVLPTISVISEIPEAISEIVERVTDVPTEKFSNSEKITTSGMHSTDINITSTEFPSTAISDSMSVELTETFDETTYSEETTFYETKSTSSKVEVNIFEKTTSDPLITSNSTDENINYNYTSTDESITKLITSKDTYNTGHIMEAGDKRKEYESELSSTIATEMKTTSELILMGETTANATKIESELNILSDHTIKMDKQGTASTESSSLYQSTKRIANEIENTEKISDDTQTLSEETTTPYSEKIDKVYEESLTTIPEKTVEISFSNTPATNDPTSGATKGFTAPNSTSSEEMEIIKLQTESLTDLEIRPNNKSTASDMEFNISMNITHVTTRHQDKNVSTPSESFTYDNKTQTVLDEISDTFENKLPISTTLGDSETLETTSEASMTIETKLPIILSSSEDTHTLSPSTEAFHTVKLAQSITDVATEGPLIEINVHQDLLSTKITDDGHNKTNNVTSIENSLQDLSTFTTENSDKEDLAEYSRISTTEISTSFTSENVQTTTIHPRITHITVIESGMTEVLNTTLSSASSYITEAFLENTSISTDTTGKFQEYSTEKPSLGGAANVNLIKEDVHKLSISTIDWNYEEINVNKTSSISTEDIEKPSIHENLITTSVFTGIDNIALELVKPDNLQITFKPFDIPESSGVKTTESATTLEKDMDHTSKVEIDKSSASFDKTETSPSTVKSETAVSFDKTEIPHSFDKTETPASYDTTETNLSFDKKETPDSLEDTEKLSSFDKIEMPEHPILVTADQLGLDTSGSFKDTLKINQTLSIHKIDHVEPEITASNTGLTKKTHTVGTVLAENLELSTSPIYWTKTLESTSNSVTEGSLETSSQTFAPSTITISEVLDSGDSITSGDIAKETAFPPSMPSSDNLMSHIESFPKTSTKLSVKPSSETGTTTIQIVDNEENVTYSHEHPQSTTLKSPTYDQHFSIKEAEEDGLPSSTFDVIKGNSEIPPIYEDTLSSETNKLDNETIESLDVEHISDLGSMITGSMETNIADKTIDFSINAEKTVSKVDYPDHKTTSIETNLSTKDGISELVTKNIMDISTELTTATSEVSKPTVILSYSTIPSTNISEYSTSDNIESSKTETYTEETEQVHEFNVETSPVATANTSHAFSETSSAPESSEISTSSSSSQYETSEIIIQETESSTESDSITFNAEFSTESHKQNPTSEESSTSDILYFKPTTSVLDVTNITSQEGTIHFNEKVIDTNKIEKDSLSAISLIDAHSDLTAESGVPLTSEFSTETETIKTDLHPPVLDANDPKYLVSINVSQMENNSVNEVSESTTEKLHFETSSDESSYVSQFTSQSSAKQDQQIVTEHILVTDVPISEDTTESETVPDYSYSLASLPTSSTRNVLSPSEKTTKYDEITSLSQEHQTIRTSIPLLIPTEISSSSPETIPSNIPTLGFEEISVEDSKKSFLWDNQVSTENYVITSLKTESDETSTESTLYSPQYETHKHEQVAEQYGETPISSSFFEQYTIVDDTFKDFDTTAEQVKHSSYDTNFTKEPTIPSSDEIFTKVITQKPLYVSFASESTKTTQQSEIEPASTTFSEPVSGTYVPVTLSDDLIIFTEKPQFPVKPFVALNKKHEIDNSILTSTTKYPNHENLTTSENIISEEADAKTTSETIMSTVASPKPSTLFDTVTIHSLSHSPEIITELGIAIHPTQLKTIIPNVSDAIELTHLPDTTIHGTTETSDVNENKIDLTTEMETTKKSILDDTEKSDEVMSTIETLGNERTTMNIVSSQDNVEKITPVNIPHEENFNTDKSEVTEGVSLSTLTIPDRDSYSNLNLHTKDKEIQNIKTTLKTLSPLSTIPYFDLEKNSTFISRESTTHPTITQTELIVNLVALENAPSIKYGHITKLPDITDATTLDVSTTEQTHTSKHDAIEKTTYFEESSTYTSKFQPTFKPAEQISTVQEINETQNITESNELITTTEIPIPKPAEIVLTRKHTEKASELEFTTTDQYIRNKISSEKSSDTVTATYITLAKETDVSSSTTESTKFVVEIKVTNETSETSQTHSIMDSIDTKSITRKELETSTDLTFNAETITVTEESLVTEEAPTKIQESETSFVTTSSIDSLETYGTSEASQAHNILDGIDTKSITEKQMDITSMGLNSETGALTVTNESTVTEEATSKIQESEITFVTTSSIDSLKQSTLKEIKEITSHETTSQPPASVTYGITKISSPEEIKISTVAPSYTKTSTAEHPDIEIETLPTVLKSDETEDPNSSTETPYTQTLFTDISENITLFKDMHSTKSKTEVFPTTESFPTSDISSTAIKDDEDINESSTYIITNKTNISGDSEKSGVVTDIEGQSTERNIYESTKTSVHIEDSSNYSDTEAGTSSSTLRPSDMTFKYVTTTVSYFTSTNQKQVTDDIQKTTAKPELSGVTIVDIKSDNEKKTETTESANFHLNTQSGYGSNDIFDVPAEIHETSHQTEFNETLKEIENISADLEKSKDDFNISRSTIIPDVEPVNLSMEEHVTVNDPKDLSQPPYNKSIVDFYPLANVDDIVKVETSTFEETITSLSILDHESADNVETTTDKKGTESIFSSDNMLIKDADKLITSLDEDSEKTTKDSTVTFQELESTTDGSTQYNQQTSSPHKIELSTSDIYKTVSTTTVDADQNSIHSHAKETSKTTNDNDIEVELQSTTNISPAAIIYNFTIKIESDLMNLKDFSTTRAVPSESLQTTTPNTTPSPRLDLTSVESSKSDLSTSEDPTSDFSTTKIPASDLSVAESTSDLSTIGKSTSDVSTTESPTSDLSTNEDLSDLNTAKSPTSDLSTAESPTSDLSTAESPTSDLSTTKSPSSDLSTAEDLSNLSTAKSPTSDLITAKSPSSDLSTAEDLSDLSTAEDLSDLSIAEDLSDLSTAEDLSDLSTTKSPTSDLITAKSPSSDLSTAEDLSDLITAKSPTLDLSTAESPTSDLSTAGKPTSEVSTTESPASDLSTSKSPTDFSITGWPTSDVSATQSPTSDLSTNESPASHLSTAQNPSDLSTAKSPTSDLSTPESQNTDFSTAKSASDLSTTENPTSNLSTTESPASEEDQFHGSNQNATGSVDFEISRHPIKDTLLGLPENISNINQSFYPISNKTDSKVPHLQENSNLSNLHPIPITKPGALKSKYPGPSTPAPWVSYTVHEDIMKMISTKFPSSLPTVVYEIHSSTKPGLPHFGDGSEVCYFDGEVYFTSEQIPQKDNCEFCFCFKGDVICLQQTCPPPIAGCYAIPIDGFCCPRFHCPVQQLEFNSFFSTTTTTPPNSKSIQKVYPAPGCEIEGHKYRLHQVVRSASNACRVCRCDYGGIMKCDPRVCKPKESMIQQIVEEYSKKK